WTQFPADKKWSLTRVPAGPGGPRTATNYNLNRITEYTGKSLYVEGDTVVWFRGIEGVVRYHLRQPVRGTGAFRVLLDRVVINGDSALYPHDGLRSARLPYAHNTLRFEYAAPAYDGVAENEFQYQLAGYDRGWSAWTKDFYKEYTRIPEGRYTFRVRARNLYGKVGTEAAYMIAIAPPWYRTWPVYGAYVLLATGLLYGLVRRRMAALQRRNVELEKIVRDRTREIAAKNEQLDAQNAQLQAQAGQLARQTAQLLELDEMKSNFFANISHEFRTPLTLVLGILNDKAARRDERRSGAPVPVSPQEISVMQRNARRLLQLINQLLDLSRIDSGRMKLHLQDGNLADLLALVAASFASLAEYRNIRFEVQLPDGPLYCRFDADKLEKVLYNLLSNAFKFTPYGGTVALEVRWEPPPDGQNDPGAAPGRLWVGVRDSGPGIPADQLEKVFDRFFQGTQLYQGDAQGTGIGLALTRELVQLHGGRIWAESPGGAYFGVELPLGTAPPTENTLAPSLSATFGSADWVGGDGGTPAVPAPGDPNLNLGLPLLLVVEDNADLRGYIRGHLEDKYRVMESENGIAGWEMALEHLPDLLISDWMMPGMNGVQLLERVKADERTSHIPFVLLTALATDEGKLTGLATGADEYLTKPFDARELELRIRNLIETRRRLRERFAREVRLQPKDIAVTSTDERFMEKVMAIVEEHLGDADFGAEQFGREVGLSRMQLHRKLTALTGQSTGDFIRTMRLKRAAQLLEARAGTVSEIAFTVGYGSLSYFTRSFREQFGVNPSEYAAKVTSGQG
ncbi:MAG: response regulator, partial [Cytophagales bacterium]|nr:response regulator [Cytophagales bacterium]